MCSPMLGLMILISKANCFVSEYCDNIMRCQFPGYFRPRPISHPVEFFYITNAYAAFRHLLMEGAEAVGER